MKIFFIFGNEYKNVNFWVEIGKISARKLSVRLHYEISAKTQTLREMIGKREFWVQILKISACK